MLHDVTNRADVPAAAPDALHQIGAQHKKETEGATKKDTSTNQPVGGEARDLEQAVAQVSQELTKVEPRLQFEIDRDLNRVIVKIMNGDSGEVIRQIPAKEVLDLARSLGACKGVLLKQQA